MVAGGAIAAGLGMAVNQAVKFNQRMELLTTQAGVTQERTDQLSQSVLKMAGELGASPTGLADGLYHLVSVGVPANKQLEALAAAAKLSKVGLSDLEGTTNALAGVLAAGFSEFKNAGQAAGAMNAAVGVANLRMTDLNAAISTGLLAKGQAAGLTFNQMAAALATLSSQSMGGQEGASRLGMTFALLEKPSKGAKAALSSIGLGAMDLAEKMRSPEGLVGALQALKTHLDAAHLSATQQASVVLSIFGGGRSGGAAQLLLQHLDGVKSRLDAINKGTGSLDASVAAAEKTPAEKLEKLKASFDALAISLGTQLLPAITPIIARVTELLAAFNNLSPGTKKTIVDVLAIAGGVLLGAGAFLKLVGPVMTVVAWVSKLGPVVAAVTSTIGEIVFAFSAWAGGAATAGEALGLIVAALGGPVTLAIAAGVALVAGFALAWKTDFGHIREHTAATLDWIKGAIPAAWAWITKEWFAAGAALIKGHEDEWRQIKEIVLDVWDAIKLWTRLSWDAIKGVLQVAWASITTIFRVAGAILGPAVSNVWETIKTTCRIVWDGIKMVLQVAWDSIKTLFGVALDLLTGHWDRAGQTWLNGCKAVWEDIKTAFADALQALVDYVTGYGSRLMAAGRGMMKSFADGVKSAAMAPVNAVKGMVSDIDKYLPHSDAKTGPLSRLTASGMAIPTTLAAGIRAGTPALMAAVRDMNAQIAAAMPPILSGVWAGLQYDWSKPVPNARNHEARRQFGVSGGTPSQGVLSAEAVKIDGLSTQLAKLYETAGRQKNAGAGHEADYQSTLDEIVRVEHEREEAQKRLKEDADALAATFAKMTVTLSADRGMAWMATGRYASAGAPDMSWMTDRKIPESKGPVAAALASVAAITASGMGWMGGRYQPQGQMAPYEANRKGRTDPVAAMMDSMGDLSPQATAPNGQGGWQGALLKIFGGTGAGGASSTGILKPALQEIMSGSHKDGILGGIMQEILGGAGGQGPLGGLLGGLTKGLGPWGGVASMGLDLLSGLFGGGGSHGPSAPIIERPSQSVTVHVNAQGAFFPDARSIEHLGNMVAKSVNAQLRMRTG